MPIPATTSRTPVPRPARGHVALYHALDRTFGGHGGILVLFDRRRVERRRAAQSVPEERRRGDRRGFPRLEDTRRWRCVLVRPPD